MATYQKLGYRIGEWRESGRLLLQIRANFGLLGVAQAAKTCSAARSGVLSHCLVLHPVCSVSKAEIDVVTLCLSQREYR
jgi:hypothetical protein